MATLTATGVNCSNGTLDGQYTGTSANNSSYPIGSYLIVELTANAPSNNAGGTLYTANQTSSNYTFANVSGLYSPQVTLAGTWRARGRSGYVSCYQPYLYQRVA